MHFFFFFYNARPCIILFRIHKLINAPRMQVQYRDVFQWSSGRQVLFSPLPPVLGHLTSVCFVPLLPVSFLPHSIMSFLWRAAMSRQTRFCPTRHGSLISPLCLALRLVWLTRCRVLACRPPAAAGTHPPTCNDWILLFHYGLLPPVQVSPLMISFPFSILTQCRVMLPSTSMMSFMLLSHACCFLKYRWCTASRGFSPEFNDCSVQSLGFWIASIIVELLCL